MEINQAVDIVVAYHIINNPKSYVVLDIDVLQNIIFMYDAYGFLELGYETVNSKYYLNLNKNSNKNKATFDGITVYYNKIYDLQTPESRKLMEKVAEYIRSHRKTLEAADFNVSETEMELFNRVLKRFYADDLSITGKLIKQCYFAVKDKVDKGVPMSEAKKEILAVIKADKDIRDRQLPVTDIAKYFIKQAKNDSKPLGIRKLMILCGAVNAVEAKEGRQPIFTSPIRYSYEGPYIADVYFRYKDRIGTGDMVLNSFIGDDNNVVEFEAVPQIPDKLLICGEVPSYLPEIYQKLIDMPIKNLIDQIKKNGNWIYYCKSEKSKVDALGGKRLMNEYDLELIYKDLI